MRELVQAENGPLEVERFEWSGENSEIDRREAGRRLHGRLAQLEAAKEQYCLVGHSHGGSVISAALLESAARRQQLDGLKRWITVGTPFVGLKRERLLFARLDLVRKVILIASMMLLMMFLLYIATELASGKGRLIGGTFPSVLVVTGVMMSLPAVVCYLVLKYLDGRNHLHHRPAVRARAAESFAGRWLPLTHSDDEAVQGLGFLPEARLDFFDKAFAVPTITMVSVLALPLLYLLVLASPPAMLAIGDWLKTRVYDSRMSPETEKALKDLREQLRVARTSAAAPMTCRIPLFIPASLIRRERDATSGDVGLRRVL